MPEFNDPPLPGSGDGEFGTELGDPRSDESTATDVITVEPVGKRKRVKERRKHPLARRISFAFIGLVALAVIAYAGFYAYILYKVENNIRHSGALSGTAKPTGKGMDLLLMGLDSRRDENGNPLPPDVYNALHAGTAADGGNNSNVLMYIHVSDDGSRAVSVSIPRDDWVEIPGCSTDPKLQYYVGSSCHGKIKSAYGWELAAAQGECPSTLSSSACYQKAKDAARAEEVKTVEKFLGVRISSFVEVTMGAFYEIAQQVQPITVCVKEDTVDSFSGANFKTGRQSVSAAQAVAFVRQRRDLYGRYNFTDLDRSRRQQAFIVSLLTQLKSAGTLLNPVTLNNIVNVATNNVVLSDGLNPIDVAKLASNLSGGNLHFYTLPIQTDNYWPSGQQGVGEVANQVNLTEIRAIVRNLLNPPPPVKAKPLPSGAGYTVDAVNVSGVNHAAADQLTALKAFSYTAGTATDGKSITASTTIKYNPADKAAAQTLSKRLGGTISLVADPTAKVRVLTLLVGTTLANGGSASPTAVPTAVDATSGGTTGPPTNALTDLRGVGIPCVK